MAQRFAWVSDFPHASSIPAERTLLHGIMAGLEDGQAPSALPAAKRLIRCFVADTVLPQARSKSSGRI